MKAVKNEVEINGMKSAHVKDAVALIDFMARLSKAVIGRKSGKEEGVRDFEEKLDELSVTKLLSKLRAEQKLNRGESFETISAVDDSTNLDPCLESVPLWPVDVDEGKVSTGSGWGWKILFDELIE